MLEGSPDGWAEVTYIINHVDDISRAQANLVDLLDNQQYEFRIVAQNSAGRSTPSNIYKRTVSCKLFIVSSTSE